MTIMIDRESDTEFDTTDADFEIDDAAMLDDEGEDDLDLGGLMYGCSEGGYHKDDYVLFEDNYTITRKCDDCGDTWSEEKDD